MVFFELRCVLWSISRGALNLKSQKSKITGKSRGASNLKNTICRHDAYLDGFFWQNAWSSRFKKLTLFTKYRSFWFKAKKARSFWFEDEKAMELLLYFGIASAQQRTPFCKKVHEVRPKTLGALALNGRILNKSRGASDLKKWPPKKNTWSFWFKLPSLRGVQTTVGF